MKRALLTVVIAVVLPVAPSVCRAQIKGELETINGVPVLRVWGYPYEMGYAQGGLVAEDIKTLFDEFVMPYLGSPLVYEAARTAFRLLYEVPERYEEEARGVVDGAIAAGVDLFSEDLGRDLDYIDLGMAGAMADLEGLLACSSLIAWDVATENDPELMGEPAVVRNLDWIALPSDPTLLPRKTVVVARSPEGRRRTVSVAFPGFLGCLSCMNDLGVAGLQHQSYPGIPFSEMDFSDKFIPINLAMREALEIDDTHKYDEGNPEVEADAICSQPRSSAYNVICLAPDTNHPPLVVETHNLDCVRRYDYDDPEMPESMLAVTNHMRKLQDPYYCSRYETIKNAANEWAGQATLDKMWGLAGDVAMDNEGVWEGWITAQTMIFLPVVRKIGLAYSDNDETAWTKEPTWLDWNELFGEATDDDSADDDSGDDDSADDDSAAGDDDSADDDSSSGGCGC